MFSDAMSEVCWICQKRFRSCRIEFIFSICMKWNYCLALTVNLFLLIFSFWNFDYAKHVMNKTSSGGLGYYFFESVYWNSPCVKRLCFVAFFRISFVKYFLEIVFPKYIPSFSYLHLIHFLARIFFLFFLFLLFFFLTF